MPCSYNVFSYLRHDHEKGALKTQRHNIFWCTSPLYLNYLRYKTVYTHENWHILHWYTLQTDRTIDVKYDLYWYFMPFLAAAVMDEMRLTFGSQPSGYTRRSQRPPGGRTEVGGTSGSQWFSGYYSSHKITQSTCSNPVKIKRDLL